MEEPVNLGFLKSILPFSTLSKKELAALVLKMRQCTYAPNTYVFRQGSSSQEALFLVEEGLAEVTVTSDQGQETVVGYRKKGDFFGETVILTGNTYPGSVRAVEELHCWLLPKTHFEELLYQQPNFTNFFSKILTERMRSLYQEIIHEQSCEPYDDASATFRKRLSEIMSAPVITCLPEEAVPVLAKRLQQFNISSLIMTDHLGKPLGLITEKHLVTRVIGEQLSYSSTTAEMIAEPITAGLPPKAFFYQALLTMVRFQVKQIPVMEQGKLLGIVTISDLIRTRSIGKLSTLQDIEEKQSISGLAAVTANLNNVLQALVGEKAPIKEICAIMTEFYDRLTRKIIVICEAQLDAEGLGLPTKDYCWINMGSGGRREQTLRTDQDHAIIYAGVPKNKEEQAQKYFLALGQRVTEALLQCGFQKCKGEVMASNPKWCRPLREWVKITKQWIETPDPQNIRQLTIFLDFRHLAGNPTLAEKLREEVFASFAKSPVISHFITADEVQFRQPLSLLGKIVTEKSGLHKNEINLKISACVRLVDCVRIFALKNRIAETSTWDRLQRLAAFHILKQEDVEFFEAAYEILMLFRLKENLRKALAGKEPDNYLNPSLLSKREQLLLKDALTVIGKLQKLTESHFNLFWLNY